MVVLTHGISKSNMIQCNRSQNIKLAFGEDTSNHHINSQEYLYRHINKPIDAEQILDTFLSKDGSRYYKIRWKDSWEREDCLVACERLIKEFWDNVREEQEKHQILKNKTLDQNQITSSSPPSTTTSGRRKGRPKKLVNHSSCEELTDETKSLEDSYTSENEMKDINDNIETEQKKTLHVEIPVKPDDNDDVNVEEYPVMIIREHEQNGTTERVERDQVSHYRKRSPIRSSHSPNIYFKRRYIDEPVPKKISLEHASFYHKFEEALEHTKVSPVYINSHHHIKSSPIMSIPSTYPVIKTRESYPISEGLPILYETRPIQNPQYIVRDPHLIKTEPKHRPQSPVSPPNHKQQIETSQLLLKVKSETTANFISSSIKDHKYPYQTTTPIQTSIIKHTKDHIKPKLTNITHKLVDGEQRPQCMECFQTFKKRAALERHMMIHRGIKPFQCHFCNQRFRQKHHLQGHIMLHTGERPHSCSLCNKKFRMRHHLLEHERISHKVFR